MEGKRKDEENKQLSFLKKKYLFIAVLCLRCCTQAFSSCGEWGLSRGEDRLEGAQASVVATRGLSYPAVCGIFPEQGSNSCPLHWQADS